MEIHPERSECVERYVSQIVHGLCQEILRKDGKRSLQISHLVGNGFFYPILVQLFVDVVDIERAVQELRQRIHQVREELQVIIRSEVVDAHFVRIL